MTSADHISNSKSLQKVSFKSAHCKKNTLLQPHQLTLGFTFLRCLECRQEQLKKAANSLEAEAKWAQAKWHYQPSAVIGSSCFACI